MRRSQRCLSAEIHSPVADCGRSAEKARIRRSCPCKTFRRTWTTAEGLLDATRRSPVSNPTISPSRARQTSSKARPSSPAPLHLQDPTALPDPSPRPESVLPRLCPRPCLPLRSFDPDSPATSQRSPPRRPSGLPPRPGSSRRHARPGMRPKAPFVAIAFGASEAPLRPR
jgi:hypothetical protein